MLYLQLDVPLMRFADPTQTMFRASLKFVPVSTAYGCMLSAVGEFDTTRHYGVRMSTGFLVTPTPSLRLRSINRFKTPQSPYAEGPNKAPAKEEVLTGGVVIVAVDSRGETSSPTLEDRLRAMLLGEPVKRTGLWSLGESEFAIRQCKEVRSPMWAKMLSVDTKGEISTPVVVKYTQQNLCSYAVVKSISTDSIEYDNMIPVVDLHHDT
jgi:CRISPR-associated protein Cas5/DevS